MWVQGVGVFGQLFWPWGTAIPTELVSPHTRLRDENLNNGIFENSPSLVPEGARSGGHESTRTLESFRSEFAANL